MFFFQQNWSQTEQAFFWINSAWKQDCSAYSVLACLLVRTLEWQKIFLGDWTCNIWQKPSGDPRSIHWSTRLNDAVHTLPFLAGNSTTFFDHSCPQTAHSQCNWSCLWNSFCCPMANKAWFMFHLYKVNRSLTCNKRTWICSLDIFFINQYEAKMH